MLISVDNIFLKDILSMFRIVVSFCLENQVICLFAYCLVSCENFSINSFLSASGTIFSFFSSSLIWLILLLLSTFLALSLFSELSLELSSFFCEIFLLSSSFMLSLSLYILKVNSFSMAAFSFLVSFLFWFFCSLSLKTLFSLSLYISKISLFLIFSLLLFSFFSNSIFFLTISLFK